jgi:hypothetical protein
MSEGLELVAGPAAMRVRPLQQRHIGFLPDATMGTSMLLDVTQVRETTNSWPMRDPPVWYMTGEHGPHH